MTEPVWLHSIVSVLFQAHNTESPSKTWESDWMEVIHDHRVLNHQIDDPLLC